MQTIVKSIVTSDYKYVAEVIGSINTTRGNLLALQKYYVNLHCWTGKIRISLLFGNIRINLYFKFNSEVEVLVYERNKSFLINVSSPLGLHPFQMLTTICFSVETIVFVVLQITRF